MFKVFKSGAFIGAIVLLSSCSTSEHFMQDDVYNTRTPLMPPGTDLNDVTDYATFVAKKEQSETPERTTYVSPRQYNDYFYNSQYVYYGYSPYMAMTGIGYYGYNGYNGYYSSHPYFNSGYGYGSPFYPTVGFGGYYGGGYNPYYAGNYYYGGNPYPGYGYGYGYGYGSPYYSGNQNWYTPQSKPNTPGNLGSAHAGTSSGRMGSSNGHIVSYQNQIAAKPEGFTGAGRNTNQLINSSPVMNNPNGRTVGSSRSTDFNAGTAARPASSGRTVGGERPTSSYRTSDPNTGSGGNRTLNNNNTNRTISSPNTNSRPSSSPTMRSGGGSSGGSSSGGGVRSGGRR